MLRMAYESASAISPSTNSRRRGRLSTSVTSTPRAANIDAYSTPMTPAPTTIIVRGRSLSAEDAVGVQDRLAVHGDPGRRRGPRARRDHDLVRLDLRRGLEARHRERVRRREPRGSGDQRDAVSPHLGADDLDLALDDGRASEEEVLGGDVLLHGVGRAVHPALGEAREVEHGFAEGLRRDRARVDAHAAHDLALLADPDLPAELRGLNGRTLPGRTRAEDEEIELLHDRADSTRSHEGDTHDGSVFAMRIDSGLR